MGTRSLTVMHESRSNHQEIAVLYRQMDGYPSVHGQELKDFLSGITLQKSVTPGQDKHAFANGGDCLAAQIVSYFKDGAGGFYLHPAGTRNLDEEYTYFVYPTVGKPTRLKVQAHDGTIIFEGDVKDFDPSE